MCILCSSCYLCLQLYLNSSHIFPIYVLYPYLYYLYQLVYALASRLNPLVEHMLSPYSKLLDAMLASNIHDLWLCVDVRGLAQMMMCFIFTIFLLMYCF